MKTLTYLFVFLFMVSTCYSSDVGKDLSGWSTYENKKYHYQLRYPSELEVRSTGEKRKRDGREVLISHPYMSRVHGVSIEIKTGLRAEEIHPIRQPLPIGATSFTIPSKYGYTVITQTQNPSTTITAEAFFSGKDEPHGFTIDRDGFSCSWQGVYPEYEVAKDICDSFRYVSNIR